MVVARLRACLLTVLGLAAPLAAQDPNFAHKRVPFEPGFRVFIVPDMEGMGSAVHLHEVIAGNEGERYRTVSSPGVLAHNFAFDDFRVNGRRLNEVGINALIAGGQAVPPPRRKPKKHVEGIVVALALAAYFESR